MTTHVHEPVLRSSSEIAEKAKNIHPLQFLGRLTLTLIAGFFVGLGMIAGGVWFALVFSFLFVASRLAFFGQCVRYGYHKGARTKLVDKQPE